MHSHGWKWISPAFVLACASALPITSVAQDAPQPAAPAPAAAKAPAKTAFNSPSKWDIFAGYSYLSPKGTVTDPAGIPLEYKSDNAGFILSAARYFNNYTGVQLEFSTHDTFVNSSSTNNGVNSLGA